MTWTLPGQCSPSELGDTGGTRGIGSTGGDRGIRGTWGLALQRSMWALPHCPRPHTAPQMCQLSICGPRRAQSLAHHACASKHATCTCTHTQSRPLPSISLLQHCDTVPSDTQGHVCVLAHHCPRAHLWGALVDAAVPAHSHLFCCSHAHVHTLPQAHRLGLMGATCSVGAQAGVTNIPDPLPCCPLNP